MELSLVAQRHPELRLGHRGLLHTDQGSVVSVDKKELQVNERNAGFAADYAGAE